MLEYPQALTEVDPELPDDDIERRLWLRIESDSDWFGSAEDTLMQEAAQIIAVLRAQLKEKS